MASKTPTSEQKEIIENVSDNTGELKMGEITAVETCDTYATYVYDNHTMKQDDGSVLPLFESRFASRESAKEYISQDRIRSGSIHYCPRINVVFQLHTEQGIKEYRYRYSQIRKPIEPSNNIVLAIYNKYGTIQQDYIPIVYSSDTSTMFFKGMDEIYTYSRRLFDNPLCSKECRSKNGKVDKPYTTDNLETLENYIEFLQKAQQTKENTSPYDGWVKTKIKSVMIPKGDELPIVVETPMGPVTFNFGNDINWYDMYDKDDALDKLQELYGEDFEFDGLPVYIRLDKERFRDDMTTFSNSQCDYTVCRDDYNEWQIAFEDPYENATVRNKYWNFIRDVLTSTSTKVADSMKNIFNSETY